MSSSGMLLLLGGVSLMAAEPSLRILERKTIEDAAVKQPAALTLLVPKGWKVAGGPKWYPAFVHQVSFELTVTPPAGLDQVEMFPTYWFTHSTDNPFPPRPLDRYMGQVWLEPHGVLDMLEKVTVPGFRSAMRPKITRREELSVLAEGFVRADGQTVQAGRVRIEYALHGSMVEEDFYLVLTYHRLRTMNGVIVTWSPAIMPFALRAEKGKLDAASPLLSAIAFSIQPTPDYYKALRLAQTRFLGNLAEFQRLDRLDAREIFRTREDIQAVYRNIWKERGEANQRMHRTRQDLLGGVAPYSNGDATFLLPHTHKYQWASEDGSTVILSDDVNLDPNTGSRFRWTRLKEAQR